MVQAFEEKSKREMELLAWTCANIMNCWVKKNIRPSDLLPRGFRKTNERQKSDYEKKRFTSGPGVIQELKRKAKEQEDRREEQFEETTEYQPSDDTAVIVLDREYIPHTEVSDDN